MTKLLSTAALALALATSGAAHATEDFCAVVLKPPAKVTRDKKYNPEAWLALRDGPGMKFMVMGKLREGDLLLASTGGSCKELDGKEICDEKGEWIHIIGIPPGPDDSDKTYKDYSRGWVHRKYVQTFLCESQQAEQYVPSLPPPPTAK